MPLSIAEGENTTVESAERAERQLAAFVDCLEVPQFEVYDIFGGISLQRLSERRKTNESLPPVVFYDCFFFFCFFLLCALIFLIVPQIAVLLWLLLVSGLCALLMDARRLSVNDDEYIHIYIECTIYLYIYVCMCMYRLACYGKYIHDKPIK